jgi:hypothetical protein
MAAFLDVQDYGSRQPLIIAGGKIAIRILYVEHVMANLLLLAEAYLGGADVEMFVYLEGIAAYYFSLELKRKRNGQSAFSRCGRSKNDDSGIFV